MSAEKYANLWIPIPPTVEQKQIVSYLKGETAHIGALITKNQEAIAKLQEYRTALITAAVTGKIDVREEAANAAAPLHSYNDPTKGDKPCEKTPS